MKNIDLLRDSAQNPNFVEVKPKSKNGIDKPHL